MEVILITGKQGSGKSKKAHELNLGKKFIVVDADQLNDKDSFLDLDESKENNIIVDDVTSNHLHEIKKFKSIDGIYKFRKPYTTELKDYKISAIYILSQQDISKSFRPGTFTHIKL